MFDKILVAIAFGASEAIDNSDPQSNFFDQVIEFAKTNNSEMMLVHVLSLLDDIYPGNPYVGIPQTAWPIYQRKWSDREDLETSKLRFLQQEATSAGISTQFTLNYGDPGKTICSLAKSYNADLIIVGRRGLNGLRELVIGSVSNYILHHAPCDVLTIQGKALASPQCEVRMTPAEVK